MKPHRLLLSVLLLAASAAKAQFDSITNNGTVIITGYTGPGGAVTIPGTIGGLPVTVIEGSGFENTGITSVAIPASVTNIGVQEFAPNDGLISFTVDTNNPAYSSSNGVLFNKNETTLAEYPPGISGRYSIPTNVTTVGQNAFAACYYLSGVTIPNSVTNIGPTGFGYCFSLTNVTIPSSVTSLGPDAFINCYNLPAITVVSSNMSYASVAGVLFDKSMTTLQEYPTGLAGSYTIPSGVTTIGTNAFILCNGLTGLTMPASVTTLADGAFADCAGLTNVVLGTGVSYIATSAFAGCNQLLAINVVPGNTNFSSLNGVVFNTNQTTLIRFPTGFPAGYTTPASVTSIADYAFQDCNLADVIISSNVASVGFYSFQGCGSLTNVTMSNGVTSIGEFAFGDCPRLATVTIPASVTNLPYGAFAYCGLTAAYFEGNAPVSDPSAFLGDAGTIYFLAGTSGWGSTFDGLTTEIEDAPNPNGSLQVTILPAGAAFAGAQWQVDGGFLQPSGAIVLGLSTGLHTVSFTTITGWIAPSNQIVSINSNVTNTASGTYTEEAAPASDFDFVTNAGSITITGYIGPEGAVAIPSTINGLAVTTIASQAFANISTLTAVTIPDSVTNLGESAFSVCSSLAEVTISAGVTDIGFGMFEDCFNLADVIFRGAVVNIDDYAFSSCPALQNLAIPDTVTNLGQNAFFGDGLTNVTIPASLANIGVAPFLFCNQIPAILVDPANPAYTNVAGVLFNKNQSELIEYPDGNTAASYTIPNSVTTIADEAFEYCVLTSITIPSSVTSIGNYSFESCSFLSGVTLPINLATIENSAFAQCDALTSIALPASLTNLGNVPFADCASMTSIAASAGNPTFSSTNGVLYNKPGTTVVEFPGGLTGSFAIPNGVGDIGLQAFEQCQLSSVTIPASVTNIELDAFFNCLDLGSVTLSYGLQTIGVGAFEACYVLSNFTIPASVTSIGFFAFGECNALTTVIIPGAVNSLADYAFAYCSSLTTACFEGNAPPDDGTVFADDSSATVYYLPGATGWNSTFGTAPTKALAAITLTANPTNGSAPLTVSFTAAVADGAGHPVTNWYWQFGDGSAIAEQNPSHTYAASGVFAAAIVETNSAGFPVAGETAAISVSPAQPRFAGLSLAGTNLVLNVANGLSGQSYIVLASTNAALPLIQWTPVASDVLTTSGNFSITLTNALTAQAPQQFYILETQ